MYFFCSNLEPLARGNLGPWDLHLSKLGKRLLGNATYQISTSERSGSEEEDFEYITMHFYGSNLEPPGAFVDTIETREACLN